jgi:flavin-dependent dehydrogenase
VTEAETKPRECDVLIIGAGMAGGCLARQLRMYQPELSIINIEKKDEFDYHIGESTVEVWVDYAYRVLHLGPYLMKNHFVKHGLRFFYDTKEKNLPVHEMSENGRDRYSILFNSHQLDRATFDRDLAAMNTKMGVEVLMSTWIEAGADAIALDRENGHVIQTNRGPIKCKYLVDAGGMHSPLARKLKLTEDDERHPSASYWGRFENTRIIDELGTEEWKRRVHYTQRHFSTNHMMYRGYWWWLIPVTENILSIGVETDKRIEPRKCRNQDELVAWIKEHRWGRDILGDNYKVLDFMGFGTTARKTKQYYSEDRWFLTGMSGLVIDALYSTTGINTSYSNRLIGELIKTDRSGDKARFLRQLAHFNIFTRVRYEYFLKGISNYDRQGSFEVMTGMRQAFQSTYHNSRVPEGCEDLRTVIETADAHAQGCTCNLEKELEIMETASLVTVIRRIATEFTAFLDKTGNYYTMNSGGFAEATERESLNTKYFEHPRNLQKEVEENKITYEASFRHFLKGMARYTSTAWNEEAFDAWFQRDFATSTQTLEGALAVMRDAPPQSPGYEVKRAWTSKGPLETTIMSNMVDPMFPLCANTVPKR